MKLILLFLFISPIALTQDCDSVPELNKRIVDFADKKMKKKVGTGECWDLAKYVLDETDADWDQFEEYGELIDHENECIYPGDIIQFEKIKLKWEENGVTNIETMGHHTAIVYEVVSDNEIILIHQNTGQHGRKVGTTTFRFDAIQKGNLFVYRPVSGN